MNPSILLRNILAMAGCLIGISLSAQDVAWRDTLQAAVKTDARRVEVSLGRLQTGLEGIRTVVSPLGEGDPIRWALAMPGVTTGADGTTAMYVRGGSTGNNLFSLDGVPVYGYSHILGLTTIVPIQVIDNAELIKGGFDGAESNFTAAHLKIVSKDPSDAWKTSVALNNFLFSAGTEGPIGKKLSFILSARISPLTWEYRAVRGSLPSLLGGMDVFNASVGDLYGKLHLRINGSNSFDASLLGSIDRYAFDSRDASYEVMGWNNLIGIIRYRYEGEHNKAEVTVSANRYGSYQEQIKLFRETENRLSLRSLLTEYSFQAGMFQQLWGESFKLGEGANIHYAQFAPGQVHEETSLTNTLLATAWLQGMFSIRNSFEVKAVFRCNTYHNYSLSSAVDRPHPYPIIDPLASEVSLSLKWKLSQHISLEGTYDQTIQYYHTLEGLPVGWSLDMVVPSGERVLPEKARQGNLALSGRSGAHSFSLGGFYKSMWNLIYYKYSQALFSGAMATWENDVELGNGRSYGLEALYEFQQKEWYSRVSYTLSKTSREDFPSFYGGKSFHARFDKRHVVNVTTQWNGFSAVFILQSGHWENGAPETYPMPDLWANKWMADYYSGVNNYHMPTVIRLDLGYQFGFKTGKVDHDINLGVCNVTNHFNPFMLYFDASTESWKEIALLPIMPNFSYRISF